VTVDEILTAINIALGNVIVGACPTIICLDVCVDIGWILEAVDNALNECPALRTPTATPTPSAVPPQTPTPKSCQPEPSPSPTTTGAGIILGTAQGAPGTEVVIEASLKSVEVFLGIAGVQNDFSYDASKVSVPVTHVCRETAASTCTTDTDCNGDICVDAPDCQVNPALHKEASIFRFLPLGCSGTDCTGVRAMVFSLIHPNQVMPDGSVLYSCKIDIAAAVTGETVLSVANVAVSCPSPPGCTWSVTGLDGRVVICPGPVLTAAIPDGV
jgi:hypothetical protein